MKFVVYSSNHHREETGSKMENNQNDKYLEISAEDIDFIDQLLADQVGIQLADVTDSSEQIESESDAARPEVCFVYFCQLFCTNIYVISS